MVEEKGKEYERAVREFDRLAGQVIAIVDKTKEDKKNHVAELVAVGIERLSIISFG
jgi:hypothetical protein